MPEWDSVQGVLPPEGIRTAPIFFEHIFINVPAFSSLSSLSCAFESRVLFGHFRFSRSAFDWIFLEDSPGVRATVLSPCAPACIKKEKRKKYSFCSIFRDLQIPYSSFFRMHAGAHGNRAVALTPGESSRKSGGSSERLPRPVKTSSSFCEILGCRVAR